MKITPLVLTLSAVAALAFATTPLPFSGELGLLDRILAAARVSETSEVALRLLECVAEGHTEGIEAGWEVKAGIAQNQLRAKEFSDPYVRAHALWNIGETGLPEALQFLVRLTRSDFRVDASGRLWVDAQVALSNALLNQIADAKLKTEFLVRTMKTSVAASWAAEELCNRGGLSALPDIRQWMKSRRNGPRDDDDIEFCEARMQAVARDPDRARALGSVFSAFMSMASSYQGRRLLTWAIGELDVMKSPEADAELDRFREELGAVIKGTPGESDLLQFQQQIRDVFRARSR